MPKFNVIFFGTKPLECGVIKEANRRLWAASGPVFPGFLDAMIENRLQRAGIGPQRGCPLIVSD